METENEQAQEVYEQEVTSQVDMDLSDVATEDDFTPPTKAEYTKLKRKAIAYDALKVEPAKAKVANHSQPSTDKLKELELKIDGYSRDEIELIKEFGYDKVENPIVKKAIESMRQERKDKEADTQVSSKSAVHQKYTQQDLNNMSVEELRKILPHAD